MRIKLVNWDAADLENVVEVPLVAGFGDKVVGKVIINKQILELLVNRDWRITCSYTYGEGGEIQNLAMNLIARD